VADLVYSTLLISDFALAMHLMVKMREYYLVGREMT
jgi:hypothetical protein